MAKYRSVLGRPVNFKFGGYNIKVGKIPVEISDAKAASIMKQYPGWIERVDPEQVDEVPIPVEALEAETEELQTKTEVLGPESEALGTKTDVLQTETEVLEPKNEALDEVGEKPAQTELKEPISEIETPKTEISEEGPTDLEPPTEVEKKAKPAKAKKAEA